MNQKCRLQQSPMGGASSEELAKDCEGPGTPENVSILGWLRALLLRNDTPMNPFILFISQWNSKCGENYENKYGGCLLNEKSALSF